MHVKHNKSIAITFFETKKDAKTESLEAALTALCSGKINFKFLKY